MNRAWRDRLQHYNEPASAAMRRAADALKRLGRKAEHIPAELATAMNLRPRRPRSLLYPEGEPVVLEDEWHRIRIGSAAVLRRAAAELRRQAAEDEAAALELENQGTLWGGEWSGGGGSKRRSNA